MDRVSERLAQLQRLAAHGEPVEVTQPRRWPFKPRSLGWVSVEDAKGTWEVLVTSHKTAHYPLIVGWSAIGASVDKKTGLRDKGLTTGAWRTALTLHEVPEREADQVFQQVMWFVEHAG